MVVAAAFVATAVATLFAQATLVRATRHHRPQDRAWTVALVMVALASAALATGVATGWDPGTFRVFYLLGAVLSVPWLAMGTVHLLAASGRTASGRARRVEAVLAVASGFAAGVLVSAPMAPVSGTAIPVGKDVFGVLPRVLAAVGSGVGATVILVGAGLSMARALRSRGPAARTRATANGLIALGTLILSGGGTIQGIAGRDTAFALSLAVGISVVYAGFLVAARPVVAPAPADQPADRPADQPPASPPSSSRRSSLPA